VQSFGNKIIEFLSIVLLIRYLLPKGNGRQIRQKSFLVPVAQREPKSGSLKRGHIFITQLRRGEGYCVDVPGEKLDDIAKETSDASSESITNEVSVNKSNSTRRPRSSPHCESSSSYFNRQQRLSTRSSGLNKDSDRGENGNVFEELLTAIRQLVSKQEEIELQNNLVAEWRLVAQVVDRILFWIFFTFTMSSSTMILLILPIYKRSWYGSPLLIINDTDLVEP